MRSTGAYTIRLLGSLEADAEAGSPTLRRKTWALLAYLAATGQAHRRRTLIDMFCQEADDPGGALRWHLSRIRRQLDPAILRVEENLVQFNAQSGWVDCLEFEQTLSGDLSTRPLQTLLAALDLYRGEFLDTLTLSDAPEFELWLLSQRTYLRRLYERGLTQAVTGLMRLNQYEAALQRAQQLLQSNPLLEEIHAHLIWLHAQTGQQEAALAQFEHCRELLWRELAVEPTPALHALQAQVKAGHIESALKSSLLPAPTTQELDQIGDLVSREPELAQLQQAWQLAGQGQGTVALIEAEAGSGKTRLAREFGHSLPGARFLSGECYESTRTLPYYPWLDLLETHLANLDEASLNRLSPFWLDYLLRLLPGLAGRLGRTVPPAPAAGEGEIEHLFAAVTELLFHLPQPQPLLIFIDNLQWADEASLRLFHFVARRIRRAKALLLGAFRAEEVHDAPALQTLLEDLRRNALLHLRLPPLNLEAVALLTAQLWPNLPAEARPRVCAMLAESTGGNALFVTQVLTELAHTAAAPASLPVPESVRDLIRHRLRRLPESSQQVIEAIGVIGWPVTPSQAQQVSGRTEEETIVAIDWGLRWGLLELQEGALPSQYGFSHDLVREAVISQLSDIRRWLLHRRTAALLIQTAGLARPAQRRELAGRITHHALPGEDFGLVAVWAPLAAEHARSVGAYADALAAYEVAQTALAHLSPGAHPDPSSELTLTLNQIEMLHLLGRRAEETTLLQSVVGLLKQQPQAQLQASFYLRQALCLEALSDYESAAETARQAYQSYMQLGDSHDAARCLYLSGVNRLRVGQNEAGRSLLEQALELYRANGELSGENLCLTALAVYAINFAQIETALALMARALEIVTQQGDLPGRARACYITGLAWTFYYRADKIRSFAQEVRALGLELGETALVAKSLLLLAASYRVEGQLVEAQTLYEQAFNEAQQSQDNWLAGWSAQVLGRLALGQRDLPAAARWFQHAYQIRREHGQAQNQLNDLAWMGRLRLAQGQPAEALSYTTEAVEHMELLWGQVYVFERWDVFMAHAEALAVAGQQAAALTYVQRAYEALLKFAHQISDATTKRHFLATYLSSRIVNAYNSGQIRPFPD